MQNKEYPNRLISFFLDLNIFGKNKLNTPRYDDIASYIYSVEQDINNSFENLKNERN